MSKAERIQNFEAFLKEEGYAPILDADGDLVFKCEGRTYLILLEDNDEEFFRIVFPNFWRIESPAEREAVQRAALQATAETKVAKVYPLGDNTWATIEMFCPTVEEAKPVFERSMNALHAAVALFVEEMRK